ncbi:MAG: aminoacyl-histidine dipeptidase [Epulopiscium sp.]|nr:aminoacyl-histidine dipeptidase [Candidatus Epulonipiscium sp.]
MDYILKNIEPKKVFYYFEEITRIPRESGNEQQISDYIVSVARKNNLEVIQDQALNVIIKKPGTRGYEKSPTVIIQGHMDMVCEKNKNVIHDFDKDPIPIIVDGDYIRTKGTTLGADNGIAVAYMLALLDEDDIEHPPLEAVFTTDEEMGMKGVIALDESLLNGRILINIDTETEGELLISCAGGSRSRAEISLKKQIKKEESQVYRLSLQGLKGGHSGTDICLGRGNANLLIGRILYHLDKNLEYNLIKIQGGSKDNAIPREADAMLSILPEDEDKLRFLIDECKCILKKEYASVDPDLKIQIEKSTEEYKYVLSQETKDKILTVLLTIPNGVQTMSAEMPNLVQSSLNLGIVRMEEESIIFTSSLRSSIQTLKEHMKNQLCVLFKQLEGKVSFHSDYPAWEYQPHSAIRKIFQKVYQDIYGKQAKIQAIHAGLECGIFAEKIKDIDMISFGPNMWDVHTPNEHVSISSVERTWNYLLAILKEIK